MPDTASGGDSSTMDPKAYVRGKSPPRDNPFIDLDSPLNVYEAVKMLLIFPFALVRCVLVFLLLLLMALVGRLVSLGVPPEAPLTTGRQAVVKALYPAICRTILAVLGMFVSVSGKEHIAEAHAQGAIGVFNHISYLDIPVLLCSDAFSFMAKIGVSEMPVVSSVGRGLQVMYVVRRGTMDKPAQKEAPEGHVQKRESTVEKMRRRSEDPRFPILFLAPEGTTTYGRGLIRFKTGAFAIGRPVLPARLEFPSEHFNVGWGIVDLGGHLWRLCCQVYNKGRVKFLPVYTPSPEELADPKLFADNVRRYMARHGEGDGLALEEIDSEEKFSMMADGVTLSCMGRVVEGPTKAAASNKVAPEPPAVTQGPESPSGGGAVAKVV